MKKRLISLLLTGAVILSLTTTAYAQDEFTTDDALVILCYLAGYGESLGFGSQSYTLTGQIRSISNNNLTQTDSL